MCPQSSLIVVSVINDKQKIDAVMASGANGPPAPGRDGAVAISAFASPSVNRTRSRSSVVQGFPVY